MSAPDVFLTESESTLIGRWRIVIGENVQKGVVLTFHEGSVHADVAAGNPESIGNLVLGDVDHLRKLVVGRLALVLLLELGEGLVNLVQGTHLVQRKPDDAALLGKGLEDALANPPHGVGNEFEATGLVELLGGLDQAQVALVDEVREAESLVLVLLGHGNHKAQIGAGKLLQGGLVSFTDTLGQFHFLFRRHQLFPADFLEVLVQGGAFTVGDRLGNLQLSHSISCMLLAEAKVEGIRASKSSYLGF